jgi:16S rRNA (guanine966-N2)-methyltransferase
MRIVAGRFRGRAIATPSQASPSQASLGPDGLRPTSDRVREAVFNILAHGMDGFTLADAKVVDLFAGTGAIGLEALSRGAAFCLFVETDAAARGLIRTNVEAFGLTGESKIFRRDATDLGSAGPRDVVNLAFLDPPYDQGLADIALASLVSGGWLAPGAVVVIEERSSAVVQLPPGLVEADRRRYGDTQVIFARCSPIPT